VADLDIPGIELLDPKSNVIVGVGITRAARSAAGAMVDDEEEESAEGAEASEASEE
jgi:large subunit ribosomal protein L25